MKIPKQESDFPFPYGYAFTGYSVNEDCNITIEQIPDYRGGLVFDGINDYAICENMPIQTDYTLVVIRKLLTTNSLFNNYTASKAIGSTVNSQGAFMFERIAGARSSSFGSNSYISISTPQLISYQTKTSYNGQPITPGSSVDNDFILIGKAEKNTNAYYNNMVFYAAELYNRTLTDEEIEQVKSRMLTEWYEKAFDPKAIDYQALWVANGKTNDDVDKNVPNLVDPANPLVCSNFAWGGNSGYGLYSQNFCEASWYVSIARADAEVAPSKVIFTSIRIADIQFRYEPKNKQITIPSYRVKISGIEDGQTIKYTNGTTDLFIISSDGIYNLPSFDLSNSIYIGFRLMKVQLECNITIEQIPEGEGLYFNGVDDLFQSEKSLPALEKYTVVGDFDIITPKGKGFIKYKNWYIYKNIVRISSSISYTVVTDAFAISSSGLVVTKSGSLVTSEVGTETSLSQIISDVSLQVIFRSLAIIPEELNEEQIRVVYEYLKTLKANNIG